MVKVIRMVAPFLLVGWMIFIFSLSAENSAESSQTSGGIVRAILEFFYPNFKNLSLTAQNEMYGILQFIVRKTAHFIAYGILGVLSFLSFITYSGLKTKLRISISLLICLLYSVSDEIHQYFVPGRSCELRDVAIDFCGSLLAVTVMYLIVKFSRFKVVLHFEKKRTL